jgi:hypothetical protein
LFLPTRGLRPGLSCLGPSGLARIALGGSGAGVRVRGYAAFKFCPQDRLQSMRGVTKRLFGFVKVTPVIVYLPEVESPEY